MKPGSAEGVEVSHMRKDYGGFVGLALVLALLAVGFWVGLTALKVVGRAEEGIRENMPTQSWEENLKKNDHGCPSAIYIAPGGELKECEFIILSDGETPADKPVDHTKYFKTVDEAAIYVVGKIYELSHYYEFGGVIVKTPKGYSFTQPQTQHHGMDVSFDEDPESYDYPIVATYHVHPCLKDAFSGVFSPQDLAGTRVNGHPGYVLDECTGDVHYWAPGDGYLDADGMLKLGVNPIALMQGVQLSAGKVIGHVAVDGVVLN